MDQRFTTLLKVRSYELDAYGHVNHAVFLNYFEQARVEFLEQQQLSFGSLWDDGYIFVIVRAEVDYLHPLLMFDEIEIHTEITGIGNTSVTLSQDTHKLPGETLVCRGKFVAVFLDKKSRKPVSVPDRFRKEFL
jgi:acyl-CoA thioester hydrolase